MGAGPDTAGRRDWGWGAVSAGAAEASRNRRFQEQKATGLTPDRGRNSATVKRDCSWRSIFRRRQWRRACRSAGGPNPNIGVYPEPGAWAPRACYHSRQGWFRRTHSCAGERAGTGVRAEFAAGSSRGSPGSSVSARSWPSGTYAGEPRSDQGSPGGHRLPIAPMNNLWAIGRNRLIS
jgi:hypothetical protein